MRAQWLQVLNKITGPVFNSINKETLHRDLPFMAGREDKQIYSLLECIGRTFSGIAPFLNSNVHE